MSLISPFLGSGYSVGFYYLDGKCPGKPFYPPAPPGKRSLSFSYYLVQEGKNGEFVIQGYLNKILAQKHKLLDVKIANLLSDYTIHF